MVQTSDPPANLVADRIIDAMVQMARAAKRSRRFSVDQGSYFLLQVLARRGRLRLTELASAADLDTSTVSRHLRHLEDSDLVASRPDPLDGRAKHFTLTDNGTALLDQAREERRTMLGEQLATWSESDVCTLERLMTRLADEVLRSNPATCPPFDHDKEPQTSNDTHETKHRKEERG